MNLFLQLNQHKLKFAFVFCSLLGLGAVSLLFILGYMKQWAMPDVSERNYIFFGAGVGLPVFILTVAWLSWEVELRKMRRLLSVSPFSELKSIGFFDGMKNMRSKWNFTEIILVAQIDGFSIVCEADRNKKYSFSMTIYLMPQSKGEPELQALKRKFDARNIDFNNLVARKWYNTRKPQVTSIEEVKQDLEEFVQMLKAEGYEGR